MKTKFMQLFGLMAVLVAFTPSHAQVTEPTPSTSGSNSGSDDKIMILPIQSQDAIREYALGLVDHGSRGVSADSIDWNYNETKTWTSARGNGAEAVLDQLFASELKYKLTNPNDKISGYVYLYDKYDNLIFYGYAEFSANGKGDVEPVYGIWLYEVPILENAEVAEVLALNEDGTTGNRRELRVNNYGQVMFRPWQAGSPNGILVVMFRGGTTMTFNLWNPVGDSPTLIPDGGSYKIQGHYVYNPPACPAGYTCVNTLKIVEVYDRPTVLVRALSALQISLDVQGIVQENGNISFERPYAVDITDSVGTTTTVDLNTVNPTTISLPQKENYRLKFHWVRFALPNMLYSGPMDDGGKG